MHVKISLFCHVVLPYISGFFMNKLNKEIRLKTKMTCFLIKNVIDMVCPRSQLVFV